LCILHKIVFFGYFAIKCVVVCVIDTLVVRDTMGFAVTELNVARRRRQDFWDYVRLLHCIDMMESMMSFLSRFECTVTMSTMDLVRNDRRLDVNFSVPLEVPRHYLTLQEARWRAAEAAARRHMALVTLPPKGPAPAEF
jgi:hypothetical protein